MPAATPNFTRRKTPTLAKWLAIFNFTRSSHLYLLVLGLASTIVASALAPAVGVLMGKFGDAVTQFGGGNIDSNELRKRTQVPIYGFAIIGCISLCSNALAFIAWGLFGDLQAKSVRHELFRNLLDKDLDWFEARESGIASLLIRLQTQIRELQLGTSQPLSFAIHGLVEGCMAFGLALYYSWRLTLVVLSSLPLAALIMHFLSQRLHGHINDQHTFLTEASRIANHSIVNISLIKCFNTQAYETSCYVSAISKAANPSLKQARINALQSGLLTFSLMVTYVIGFWYGGKLVHDGKSTAGEVITSILTAFMAMNAFQTIVPQILILAKAHAAAVALQDLWVTVERGQRFRKRIDGLSPDVCQGLIQFKEVSFAYPSRPDHIVLQSSSMTFEAGATTFVIGKSGSGKSTIGNLLMRFYAARSGTITIDGNDLQDLDTNWLRNNITLVQQDTFLFNETIYRNIALGQRRYESVTSQQIWDCVELASLSTTIAEMPYGIDTKIGVGGRALSGGQTQRVALARARLRNTPVLMLDESTSALDSVNRKNVMQHIRSWRAGMTTIIVTHDTSQIDKDDYVYVLEEGSVVDHGCGGQLKHFRIQTASNNRDATSRNASHGHDSFPKQKHQDRLRDVSKPYDASFEKCVNNMVNGQYLEATGTVHQASRVTLYLGGTALAGARSTMYMSNMGTHRAQEAVPQVPTVPKQTLANVQREVQDKPTDRTSLVVMGNVPPLKSPRLLNKHGTTIRARFGGPAFHKLEIEAEKPDMSLQTIFATVWPTLGSLQRVWVVLSFVIVCVRSAVPALFAYCLARICETYYMTDNYESKAMKWCIVLLVATVAEGVLSYFNGYLPDIVARAWVDKLRAMVLQRILAQPKAWFEHDENTAAFLASVLDRNAEEMRSLVSRSASAALCVILMLTVSLIWAFVVCWQLALIGAAAMPVLASILKMMEITASRCEKKINDTTDAIGAVFAETFTDIRTVRSLTLEAYFHRKYAQATSVAFKAGRDRSVYVGGLFGLSESSIHFLFAVLVWYAVRLATSYEVGATDLFTALSLTFLSCTQTGSILALLPMVAMATESATRVIRLIRLRRRTSPSSGSEQTSSGSQAVQAAIKFSHVTFSYPTRPHTQILRDLDLRIAAGKCTAIVGRSGCGKSTIAALITGLYPIGSEAESEGSLLEIFGQSVQTISPSRLSKLVAIVPQHPILIPATTVWDNITYGLDPHTRLTSRANVELAAQQAAIHDFILSLPQQYDTVIGEGGLGLSGGQAQRVVIARALVRRPKILVLDEAMAALDAESAADVQKALAEVMKGENGGRMTVVVITHATEMMKFADNVVMLDEGQVVEQGTFEELVAKQGRFAGMLGLGSSSSQLQ